MDSLLDLSVIRRLRDFTLSVELTVKPGEILILTGKNGSGKSTALHLIAGLMRPESGYVQCNGTVLFNRESKTDIPSEERRIGYIFQNAVVFPYLTVYDNIAYGCRARGIDRAATDQIVRKLLNRLAISHLSGIKAGQLSGGQRQMVVLARALAIDPILLLLDEPFRALDGDSNLLVNRSIENEVKRSGIPCILVTHNPEEVRMDFCHTFRMEKGRIIDP
ncbi:MAG: ATP-binding cassette domain-containing protein [Methanoregulaceae archaeon]|nr:ATP-binding cassette domain-containing protein [Methanoregulaceae archaeon]